MLKYAFLVAVVAGLLTLLAACGDDDQKQAAPTATPAGQQTPAAGETPTPGPVIGGAPLPDEVSGGERWVPKCPEPDPAVQGKTIGFVSIVGTDRGITAHLTAFRECGDKYGWTVREIDAQGDYTKAAAAIDDFVSQGVDLIWSITLPPDVVGPQIQRAAQAGIPYISVDTPWAPGVTVAMPNDIADAPSKLAWYIGGRFQGQAEVGVVGSKLLSTAAHWEDIFMAALEGYPGVKVVARMEIDLTNVIASVQQGVQTMLQSHPEIDAIWVNWEDPVIGACNAKKALNHPVEIGTILTSGVALELFGECLKFASSLPEYGHGLAAAEQAYMIFKYGKPSASVIFQSNGFWTANDPPTADEFLNTGPQSGVEFILFPGE